MAETRKRAMSWSAFERIYGTAEVQPPDTGTRGQYAWLREQEIDHHRVWSLVDDDYGQPTLIPGFHVVNMIGYHVSERPWTDEQDERGLWVRW